MIVNRMTELAELDLDDFQKNVKVIKRNYVKLLKEIIKITDSLDMKQLKQFLNLLNMTKEDIYYLDIGKETDEFSRVGFVDIVAVHMATIIKLIKIYSALTTIFCNNKEMDQLAIKLYDRVEFFVNDLVFECYAYLDTDDDKLNGQYYIEINNLLELVMSTNLDLKGDFPFFTEEQNKMFLKLLNMLQGVKRTINNESSYKIMNRLRNINQENIIGDALFVFPEFEF